MTWQRARNPGQKAERVQSILNAARELFDEKDLPEISMRDIALGSGLSKASLYSYFKTKEEVFASLFQQECGLWLDFVAPRLARLRAPSPSRVAKILTDALREHQRFCRLTAVLSLVLERNMSVEFVRQFKMELFQTLGQIIAVLKTVFPTLTDRDGTSFLYQHHSLVAGLWPLAHPSREVAQVMAEEPFQGQQVDFFELIQPTLTQLLEKLA